jgi:hypothetical protein
MTSLKVEEFDILLPYFAGEYATTHSETHTRPGQVRQRKAGGGNKPKLVTIEDKLLFILVYKKTYPLQTAHGLMFGMGQSQANEWIHRLSPILESALQSSGYMPERDGRAFEQSGLSENAPMDLIIDGTERRKQRPKDPEKQKEAYSGKKRPIRTRT